MGDSAKDELVVHKTVLARIAASVAMCPRSFWTKSAQMGRHKNRSESTKQDQSRIF